MKTLQEAFREVIAKLPVHVTSDLIRKRLAEEGISRSEQYVVQLAKKIIAGKESIRIKNGKGETKEFKFTDADATELLQKLEQTYDDRFIEGLVERLIAKYEAILFRKWPKEARAQKADLRRFSNNLNARWGQPIDQLKMLLAIGREAGQASASKFREKFANQKPLTVDVVVRLHARACQLTDEIVSLLENGFADGALAHWRMLHEVTIILLFIADRGEDVAERYRLHEHIESWRAAREYQAWQSKLGYAPLSDDEFKSIEKNKDDLVKRFGKSFSETYGWSVGYLGTHAGAGFAAIARAINMEHLSAHVRMASHNVHANPKSLYFKLGLLEDSDVLLAGRSNAGLADPLHLAALSLTQATSVFLKTVSDIDLVAALKTMSGLVDQIGNSAIAADRRLKEDHEKFG